MNIGVIGCGNISTAYLKIGKSFSDLNFVALADLDIARAKAQSEQFGVPFVESPGELLADDRVEVVLNLTVPAAHATVGSAAISSGKHVYGEKPLAVEMDSARNLLESAEAAGLRVGSAPDTFLGAGGQTAREILDAGTIGFPVAATAFMLSHGPDHWHPNPEFYYLAGGGPMFDMGPYYLAQLVNLLGPVRRVTGMTRKTFETRYATAEGIVPPRPMPVEVPTHVAAMLEFHSGAIGTMITSFDVYGSTLPRIEVYGSEGSLFVPDPNIFGGEVWLQVGREKPQLVENKRPYGENSRSLGLADMVRAIKEDRPHRCSGAFAFHVLEIMHAIHRAYDEACFIDIESTVDRPEALNETF